MDLGFHFRRAVEINTAALTRIMAGLVALLAAQGGVLRLPLPVYREIVVTLHKAESAVRRLIVIAARKLVVPLPVSRPMPAGLVIARKGPQGPGRMAFQLFDTRQNFTDHETEVAKSGPRIRFVGEADPRAQFLAMFAKPKKDDLSSEAETLRLSRRLEAVNRALENLSREAKRMVRWRSRRKALENPKFTSPLRPGPPPGRNKQSKSDIDAVLRECHALAWDVLMEDTS